jgi:hypothetical protein
MRLERLIPAERDLPKSRFAARRAHIVSQVANWDHAVRRRKQRRALILVPAVLALLAASGFTTYALTREPTHFESIGCFEQAALDANVAIVSTDGRDPAAICAELWEHGDMGSNPVPGDLASCVLESGAIGVFPSSGRATCEELGLADLPASYAVEGPRFTRLRDAIVAQLGEPASGSSAGSSKCVGEERARAIVRDELDAHGYGEWGIEVVGEGFTAERPCAEVSFNGERQVVEIIAMWE